MLVVIIQLNRHYFALEASHVKRIVIAIPPKPLPKAPKVLAGSICYEGKNIPVFDLQMLIFQISTQTQLSSKILIVQYQNQLLGLLAQSVTQTLKLNAMDKSLNSQNPKASPLRSFFHNGQQKVERLQLDTLIPAELHGYLDLNTPKLKT